MAPPARVVVATAWLLGALRRCSAWCNATTCDACVANDDDGVEYGRGCEWCMDGPPEQHVCFNYFAPGGSTFCKRYALLNQCGRMGDERDRKLIPEWLPIAGALTLGVLAAVICGLAAFWKRSTLPGRAQAWLRSGRRSSEPPHDHDVDLDAETAVRWQAFEWTSALSSSQPTWATVDADGEPCVVCLQRPRSQVLYPCGHRVCCEPCARQVRAQLQPKCPICRRPVRDHLRVYG